MGAGSVLGGEHGGRDDLSHRSAQTNEVAETIEVGNAPAGIAATDDFVAVSVQAP